MGPIEMPRTLQENATPLKRGSHRLLVGALAALTTTFATIEADSVSAANRSDTNKLTLPAIFGDHMILQQQIDVPVWGWAPAGETVRVTLDGQRAEATATADGKWVVRLPAMPVTQESTTLTVVCGEQLLEFCDVLLGDVWLCSGQSNMQFGVKSITDSKQVIAEADHPEIRFFHIERQVAFDPAEDMEGKWMVCTPKSIVSVGSSGLSGVAYFFGHAIQQARDIPIGLIASHVGGSEIQFWSSLESLETSADPDSHSAQRLQKFRLAKADLPRAKKEYETEILPRWEKERDTKNAEHMAAVVAWKKLQKSGAKNLPPRPEMPAISKRPTDPVTNLRLASVLFNGMIHPLIPYGLKGVIWYQGESNGYPVQAEEYRVDFPRMIGDWRKRWKQGDVPFLFVQLPNIGASRSAWMELRESQTSALELPKTGMAVAIDAGDPKDIHPANKKPVGERLALAARRIAYGEDIVASGPLLESARSEGREVHLSFTEVGTGLMTGLFNGEARATESEEVLTGFELADETGKFHPAQALIDGASVVVSASESNFRPTTVRYAWAPSPDANLYNREGLPAAPFRFVISK